MLRVLRSDLHKIRQRRNADDELRPPGSSEAGFFMGDRMIGDSNFAQSAEKAYAQQRNAMAGPYEGETANATVNGLVSIADRVSHASDRIDHLTALLEELALGIHGPRPEAVGGINQSAPPNVDSLASRVSRLMSSVDRLQRSYDSVVR